MSGGRGALSAAILDLDGVVTHTARLHAAAWREEFDALLQRRAAAQGTPFVPFDPAADYRRHVDGKPREDGVRDFLRSRGIALPDGGDHDAPDADTVHALAERKTRRYLAQLDAEGVPVDGHTVAWLQHWRSSGRPTALVTSSRSGRGLLERAGLDRHFDVVLDGNDLAALGLPGKPAPDLFLEAARRLAVAPARALVVEDAPAGVRAARSGGFALVVGLARDDAAADALRENGAHVVVASLPQLDLDEHTAMHADAAASGSPPMNDRRLA